MVSDNPVILLDGHMADLVQMNLLEPVVSWILRAVDFFLILQALEGRRQYEAAWNLQETCTPRVSIQRLDFTKW